MNNLLTCQNIHYAYGNKNKKTKTLENISFSLPQGKIWALTGPSGSGKSTLLTLCGLLEKPHEGNILIHQVNCTHLKEEKISCFRGKNIGFVFQFHHLLPEMTALENVMIPQLLIGESHKKATLRAKDLLEKMSLGHRMEHLPSELSGGEQQRTAIARALANKPLLLLADEPTGNLDHILSKKIFTEMTEFIKDQSASALIATHDLELAKQADHNLQPF